MDNGIQWDDQEIGGGSSGIQWDDEQPVAQQDGSQASEIAWDDEQPGTDSQNGVQQAPGLIDRALDAGASFLGRGLSAMPGPGSKVAGALLEGTNADQEDPQYRTWGEAAQDTGASALKGGVGLAQGALELSRYTPHSRFLDFVGIRPQDAIEEELLAPAQDYWQGAKSEGLQGQEELVHGADGFLGTMGAAIDNPGVIGAVVSEQAIPMMLQVGLAGKVAQAVAPMLGREAAARASGAAAVAFEGGQAGGMTGHEVRDYLMNEAKIDDLRESPDFASLEQEHGEQRARQITADRLAPVGAAMAGATTALVGKYLGEGSRVAGLVVPDGKTGLRAGASRVGMETLTEGIQEPLEGLTGDIAKSQADSTVDPTDLSQRGSEAALGMFAGMGQASGMEVGRAVRRGTQAGEAPAGNETATGPEQVDTLPDQDSQLVQAQGGETQAEGDSQTYRSLDDVMREHGMEPAKAPEWRRPAPEQAKRKTLLDNLREQYGRSAQENAPPEPAEYRGPAQIMQERGLTLGNTVEPEAAKPTGTVQRLVEENRTRRQEQARREGEVAPYDAVLQQLERENAGAKKDGIDIDRDDILSAMAKLGGLDPDQLGGEVDVATMRQMSRVGRPVVRGKGQGLTMDHMAESLSQEGFTAPDGSPLDPNSLAELIDSSSRGERVFAASSDRAGMVDADNAIAKRWFQGDAGKVENALQKYIDGKPLTPNQQGAVDDITDYLRGRDGSIFRERDIESARDMDVLQGELPPWYGEIADMSPEEMADLAEDVAATSLAREADSGAMEAEDADEHGLSRSLLDIQEYQDDQGAIAGLDPVVADYMMKAARSGATDEQINQALDNANGSRAAAIGGLLALQTGEDARGQEPLAAIDWRYEQEAGAEPAGADRPEPPASIYEGEGPGAPDGYRGGQTGRLPPDQQGAARREAEAEPAPSQSIPAVTEPGLNQRGLVAGQVLSSPLGDAGLTQEQLEAVVDEVSRRSTDGVTGWIDARSGSMKQDIDAAARLLVEEGEQVVFAGIDIANLGGLNAFHNDVSSAANRDFRAITDIVAGELNALGDTAPMRTGGDELGVFIVGVDSAAAMDALARANEKVKTYAKEQGFADIPHAKGKNMRGVSLHYGADDLRIGLEPGQVYDEVDSQMKATEERSDGQQQERTAEELQQQQQAGSGPGQGPVEEGAGRRRQEVEAEPATETPADAGVSRSGAEEKLSWKKDGRKVWKSDNGMIITDESMTVGGKRVKSFFVYQNAEERDRGNNFASAENYAEAKRKAEKGPDLELQQQTEESAAEEEKRLRQTKVQQDKEASDAEKRSKADVEAKDFRLSGSDRPADVAAAGGQQDLVAAAAEVDENPSEAQKEAGNYRKGHVRIQGLDIAIENPKGSTRSGTAPDGTQWESDMAHHYGYIKRTEGADGDQVDVFIGPEPESDQVFIIDQVDESGAFDEHKVMLGFSDQDSARDGYRANYDDGWKVGPITTMTMEQFKEWLAQGNTTKPVNSKPKKPATRSEKPDQEPSPQRIDDFGEKLEGARKDMAGKLEAAARRDTAEAPLSESWPLPDYQKMLTDGFPLEAVSVLRVLRDAVPAKPRHRGKKRMWAKKVEALRGLAMEILGNPDAAAKVRSELESISTVSGLSGAVDLYMTVGHDQSLKGLTLSAAAYSIYDGVPQNPSKTVWEVRKQAKVTGFSNMPRVIAKGDTKEQALDTFKKAVASQEDKALKSKKPVRFDIYSRRGEEGWLVGKKVGRDYVDLERLDSPSEAREYLANNQDALEAKLAKIKEVPDHRKENNSPRVGVSHRNGDVTPEQFAEEFGFRGVQFGNWVEQGRRQQDLNEAYDALMDLAGILNVPARAMSLGGELGLAFGARGKGGKNPAKAHYEPARIVINLTKKDGAGSLAHEWWHALDNYFTRERDSTSDSAYATEGAAHVSVRPEVRQAFKSVTQAVNRTRIKQRSQKLDKTRTKAYWSTGREMSARAFESYVIEQLRDQGAANDYLANIVSPEYWKAAEALTLEKENTYPYPEAAEVPAIREAFDNFFQVVETKEDDQGNVALFSMSPIEIDQTDAEYASALMNVMAQHDDVYRTPVSFEDSFKGVMQDIIPQIEVAAEPEMAEVMKATYPDLQGMWYLTLPGDQGTAYVYEEPNRVWIDVSELKSGRGGGFRIYSAVANYAHNAGKVFDGDPAGLSNLGVLRRTEQMLSSALKFGTTKHLNPHPRQVSPDLEMADIARPLNWKTDQDQHNLVEMLKSSYHNILTVVPEVQDVVFNAENGQFERNGSPVSERQFSAMAADSVRRRSEAAGSNVRGRKAALAGPVYGSASLKRAALINTVVRGKGREKWRSLLAALNDQLRRGERGGLANTLYSNTTEARPSAGLSASGLKETLGRSIGKQLADSIDVVQSNADLPSGTVPLSSLGDRIEGMYHPESGKVYLVADGLASEERAAWVAWHELWHRGVRSIDGRRGKLPGSTEGQALRQAVNRAGLNKTIKNLADAIMRDRGMQAGQRPIAVEEALAEMNAADETGDYRAIEQRYGVKVPQGMRRGIRGHIDRFLDAVRRVLSKLTGRAFADVSNREVWQIITGARAGYAGSEGAAGNFGEAEGARHSFAGSSALTADHNSLYRAMKMAKRGQSSEVIRRETGWHRSVDGKWRFEITDDGARLKVGIPQSVEDEALSRVHQEATVSQESDSSLYRAVIDDRGPDHLAAFGSTEAEALGNLHNALIKRAMQGRGFVSIDDARAQGILRVGELLDHPALFAAYPDIRDYKVELYNMGEESYGSLDIANKTIEVNHTRGNDAILSTLLHEIQHAIQDIEGFAQGGAPQQRFTDSVKQALSRLEGAVEADVMQWKRNNNQTISDAEKASELARHGLMYESAKRLIEYAQHESPSRVFRHIRNEMQWIYPGNGDPVAQELQRRFYAIPKRHKPAERKAFLAEMAMDASHWLRDQVPAEKWKQFESDPRTMKGMLRALERESSRARDKLEPLRKLEREAQDSKGVSESSRFKSPYEIYRSLAGEIEARNTQARQHMTDAERRSTPPQQTADVQAHEAIVIVGGMEVQAPKAFSAGPVESSSRSESTTPGATESEADNSIPEETRFRAMQRKLQDRFNRFAVVQDWLKEQGVKLTGGADVYRAEERMHGRIAAQLEDFRDKTVRPLVKRIRQAGSSMEQVAEFLHAQHARERNAQIAKVNKAMPDGGSGMTNAEADAVLAKYADDAEFQALANELRGITDQSRQILVDAGIITEEMADAWQAAYQHYVPLKGGPESTFTGSTGKGLTSKARLNRALGHGEREGGEWIIENILADHERAVMLAEKNLVGRHLLQMALEIGNPELLTVAQPEKRGVLKDKKAYAVWHKGSVVGAFESKAEANRFITEKTNLQGLKVSDFAVEETREPDVVYMARPQLADNETQVYVKGHAIRIQLNDELLARAWNKLGDEAVGTILQHMRGLNRYLSQVYTGYNPEFLATNMVRDLFTGTANLTGEEGTAMAVRALARYPSTFGQLLAHHVAGRTSRLMEEYREDGGQTGAAWLSDLERVGDDVRNTFDDAMRLSEVARKSGKGRAATSAWRRLIGNLLGWMEHINAAGENAFRLATYSAMRDAGKSRSEAVNAAKNVTVNFNRKGEMGASLSAMYLFFNPAIQGTASIAQAHFKGKNKEQAWAMSAGMMVAGFMYALANAGADEEEWEGVPEWEKERHIMVKTSDGWAKIPLPYGHGWFWSTGRHMADLFTGDVDPEKASLKIAASFVEEFSIFGPVVNGGELEAENLLFLAPTVMQIPGAVAVNQSSMGREVYPEMDWDEGIPDHQKMYRNTQGTVPEIVTSWLNEASGGDAVKGGRVDVSPETLKYFWRTFTGGAGSFFSDSLNIPVMLAQDVRLNEIESRETPLLRRFYRDVDVQDSRTRYYNAIEESRTALGEFMRAKRMDKQNRDTELELTRKYGLGNLEAVKVGKMAERFSTLIRLKREAQIAAMLSDKPLGWRRAQVRILEREEAKLYDDILGKMDIPQ